MSPIHPQPQRLEQVAQAAVTTLDNVARLVEESYGPASKSAELARQAYVHATLLLVEARMLASEFVDDDQRREGVAITHSHVRFPHEQIGQELKLVQREVTGLCVARRAQAVQHMSEQRADTWLGKLDHLLRKLRNELDALALRELPRPGLTRAAGYYYGEPSHQRA